MTSPNFLIVRGVLLAAMASSSSISMFLLPDGGGFDSSQSEHNSLGVALLSMPP